MPRTARFIFVLPLIATTCFVAILNGNVLCMAAGEHLAVEARHDGGCRDVEPCPADGGHVPAPDPCSDVSADFELSRDGNGAAADVSTEGLPPLWAPRLPHTSAAGPSALLLPRGTAAPPAARAGASLRTVILTL